jgi:hypothetical protein
MGVCVGADHVDNGLWIYKPISGQQTENPDPLPTDPEPVPNGEDLAARWSVYNDPWPVIGGIEVKPAAWQPAPWDQPIERLPGAPDYDALCPGPWTELHYRTNADLANSKFQTQGLGSVRIYLHPLKDAGGRVAAYEGSITGRSQCLEVVGVPDAGRKPQIKGNVRLENKVGLIVRGLLLAESGGACINAKGNKSQLSQPAFVVIHDSEFYACAAHVHFFGVSGPEYPPTYLEMIGNVSAYGGSHNQYNERSIGRFVYKSNICFAPGWGHCLKNLAHSSLIEGNVLSNAGLDGQVAANPVSDRLHHGMHQLDLYACTQSIVSDNVIVYRTSSDIRRPIAYRARRGWGGCNKGRRLAEDRWERLQPDEPAYQDTAFWAEVATDRQLFDVSFEAARASDMLFTHAVEGNRFIVLHAFKPERELGVAAASLGTLRPVADNPAREILVAEARQLSEACNNDAVCFLAGASADLRYAYDHMPTINQAAMVKIGKVPRGVPIPAPAGWAERYALFWGGQGESLACNAEGAACTPWEPPVPHVPVEDWGYDPVMQASPPLVIYTGEQ